MMKTRIITASLLMALAACNNPRQPAESPEDRLTQGATAGAGESETIKPNNPADVLPQAAKDFTSSHFSDLTIQQVETKNSMITNGTVFEVTLSNGTELDFDKDGEWREGSAEDGTHLPTAILPETIQTYLSSNHPNVTLQSVDKELDGYAIELSNDVDLLFDLEGNFIREDR